MATGVSSASATSDGTGTAEHGLCAHAVHTHPCRLCCSILAMLMAALAQAEERPASGNPGFARDQAEAEPMAQVAGNVATSSPVATASMAMPAATTQPAASAESAAPARPIASPPAPPGHVDYVQMPVMASIGRWHQSGEPRSAGHGADNDAPGPIAVASDPAYADSAGKPPRAVFSLHMDDATSATGHVGSRVQSMALALDTVLPRSGGLTIQSRLQLAYQSGLDKNANGFLAGQPEDSSVAAMVVRVYQTQPTRLNGVNGVYPFVEADLWQDHKQVININGTRIDPEMLRGLLAFNLGAHGSTNSGVKIWLKLKAGRNPGGTVGARYRW